MICTVCGKLLKTTDKRVKTCSRACGYKYREGRALEERSSGKNEEHHVAGNVYSVSLPATDIHTIPALANRFALDEALWEPTWFRATAWDTPGPQGKTLYSTRATFQRRPEVSLARAEIRALLADAKRRMPRPPAFKPAARKATGRLLELSIPDLHFGKLCWARETGHRNYDTHIALEMFDAALADLVGRSTAAHGPFEQIAFIVGNDLFNANNVEGTTAAGTRQDMDGRYEKIFCTVRERIVRAIDGLRGVAPVRVVVVRGNHDPITSYHLGDSLWCWFSNYKDVEVDNEPTERKYFQWGKVLICWTHGGKIKTRPAGSKRTGQPDYALLMAVEQPEMWAASLWREVHTAHFHHIADEFQGVRIRILPSLCPPDSWHAGLGYVGAIPSAEAYCWHKELGHVGTVIHTAT